MSAGEFAENPAWAWNSFGLLLNFGGAPRQFALDDFSLKMKALRRFAANGTITFNKVEVCSLIVAFPLFNFP